jgi:hypothetical protein
MHCRQGLICDPTPGSRAGWLQIECHKSGNLKPLRYSHTYIRINTLRGICAAVPM